MKKYCKDCKKEINKLSTRCKSCHIKLQHKLGVMGNKGNRFTIEHKQKIGDTRIRLKLSKGIKNGNYQHGNACRDKKHYCKVCNVEITRQAIRCSSCKTKELFKLGILNNKGIINGSWIDGRSYENYPSEFTKRLKEQIRKRDNYECQNCGRKGNPVHHIDYNKQNCKENNLITLCQHCNNTANINRKYWKMFYQNIIKNYINKMEILSCQ
jgi:hypothetical protein